jgi:hypothetical protein
MGHDMILSRTSQFPGPSGESTVSRRGPGVSGPPGARGRGFSRAISSSPRRSLRTRLFGIPAADRNARKRQNRIRRHSDGAGEKRRPGTSNATRGNSRGREKKKKGGGADAGRGGFDGTIARVAGTNSRKNAPGRTGLPLFESRRRKSRAGRIQFFSRNSPTRVR